MLPAFVAYSMDKYGLHPLRRDAQRTLKGTLFKQETSFTDAKFIRPPTHLEPTVEESLQQRRQAGYVRMFRPDPSQGGHNIVVDEI